MLKIKPLGCCEMIDWMIEVKTMSDEFIAIRKFFVAHEAAARQQSECLSPMLIGQIWFLPSNQLVKSLQVISLANLECVNDSWPIIFLRLALGSGNEKVSVSDINQMDTSNADRKSSSVPNRAEGFLRTRQKSKKCNFREDEMKENCADLTQRREELCAGKYNAWN